MTESTTRRDRFCLAACLASLVAYILCSDAIRKFVSELVRLVNTYWR